MRTAVIILLVAMLGLFFLGVRRQFERNSDMTRTDQSAYMYYARQSRDVAFGYVPSRNYMPIYPWIMSWFYRTGMTAEEYFAIGKRVNVAIALLTLGIVYIVFRRVGDRWDAAVALAAMTLSMAAFKAPCFQPEMLFFAISFLMFVSQLNLLLRPSWPRALVAGVLSGLAYLTKGSVQPGIALTLFCLIGRAIVELWARRKSRRDIAGVHSIPSAAAPLLAAVLFGAALCVTLFPYARASKAMYGRWICENNMYFFWCDSWKDCQDLMGRVGGERGLYRLAASSLPGPLSYWRAHTLRDGLDRVTWGFVQLYKQHMQWGYGYAKFALMYALCLALVAWPRRRNIAVWLRQREHFWATAYVAGLFAGYMLLCAWYARIDQSRRFALILLYPAMYLFVLGLQAARRGNVEWSLFGARLKASAVSSIVLLLLVEYVVFDYFYRVQFMDGTY